MALSLAHQTQLRYFRMALVTGLIEPRDVIAWADQQIMEQPAPELEIIELSLANNLPYSQLVWLLNHFLVEPFDIPALGMVFQQAARLLAARPDRSAAIAQGLSLLLAEERLPVVVRAELHALDAARRNQPPDFHKVLSAFLENASGFLNL